jgi:hypothetical protein
MAAAGLPAFSATLSYCNFTSCYFFNTTLQTQPAAKASCSTLGGGTGALVSYNSEPEQVTACAAAPTTICKCFEEQRGERRKPASRNELPKAEELRLFSRSWSSRIISYV